MHVHVHVHALVMIYMRSMYMYACMSSPVHAELSRTRSLALSLPHLLELVINDDVIEQARLLCGLCSFSGLGFRVRVSCFGFRVS